MCAAESESKCKRVEVRNLHQQVGVRRQRRRCVCVCVCVIADEQQAKLFAMEQVQLVSDRVEVLVIARWERCHKVPTHYQIFCRKRFH
jgi:hypothetical protein